MAKKNSYRVFSVVVVHIMDPLPDISDDGQHHALEGALAQILGGPVGGFCLEDVAKDEDDVLDELSARLLQQNL